MRPGRAACVSCLKKTSAALGADLGIVEFNDLDNHLVSVGQPIVWAARMEAVARSGEVIVNNLLYSALSDLSGLHFENRLGSTKTGEAFLGRSLVLTEVSEFIPPIAADRPARPHSV